MSAAMIALALGAGWLGGDLVNWAADLLPDWASGQRGAALRALWHHRSHYWGLSWSALRHGVCPHCGQRRPGRYLAISAASIVISLAALRWGWNWATGVAWCYSLFLLAVMVIDLEHRRVLNIMLAPAAVIVALCSLLPFTPSPQEMALGGIAGFGLFLLLAIIGRGALGMGDVKLAGLIGMMTGFPAVFYALIIGALLGGLAALVLLLSRKATRKSAIAYAPYLAVGALVIIIRML